MRSGAGVAGWAQGRYAGLAILAARGRHVTLDPSTIALSVLAVYLTTFMKGAFGGGFAIIGIPLLALVMDPITAGALLAPTFIMSDVIGLRYWRPTTWSKP